MVIKIIYPYKSSLHKIETKNILIETENEGLIKQLTTTNNPIDIGIILSQNEDKYKTVKDKKEDLNILIEEVLNNPDLF